MTYASMRRGCAYSLLLNDACSNDLIRFTVIIINGCKLGSAPENKTKLMQWDGNIVKTFERQLGQGKRSDFVYGPFHPASAKKQETDDQTVKQQERKTIQDWENLAVSFRPQYQNQGELNISFI